MEDDLEFLGAIIPHVIRGYPFDGRPQTYKIFFSLLLGPPSQQGEPGDFFVGAQDIFIKSNRGRWNKAHFNLPERHPLVDENALFQDLHLFHDELGPGWTQSQSFWRHQKSQLRFRYTPVAVQFYRALAHHKCQPGSSSEHPIHIL